MCVLAAVISIFLRQSSGICVLPLDTICCFAPFTAIAPLPASKYRKEADGWEKESLPQLCQWSALWPSTNDVTHTSLMLQFPHVTLSQTRPLCGCILWKGVVSLKEKKNKLYLKILHQVPERKTDNRKTALGSRLSLESCPLSSTEYISKAPKHHFRATRLDFLQVFFSIIDIMI